MPHCKIEITQNLLEGTHTASLMEKVARAIYAPGCFRAEDIKVRIYPVAHSFLGIEPATHAYAAAEIQIFPDKEPETEAMIIDGVQAVLEEFFHAGPGKLSLTSRINYLDKRLYRKFTRYE